MSQRSSPLAGVTSVVCIGAGGSATALLLAIGLDVNGTLTSGRARCRRPDPAPPIIGTQPGFLDAIDRVRSRAGIPSESVSLVRRRVRTRRRDRFRRSRRVPWSSTDRPGQDHPLTATRTGCLPPGAVAWDFNYRGPLTFLSQARAGQPARRDGWHTSWPAGQRPSLPSRHRVPPKALLQKAMAATRSPSPR